MALKNGKPNPLNYFDMRRVEFAAPHFKYTTLDRYNPGQIKSIDIWIRHNHHANLLTQLDIVNLVTLFVQQVGCHRNRQDGANLSSAVFSGLLFDQSQDGERQ